VAHWVLKEEPTHYSWSDLLRDGETRWDGVHNALALRHLKSMSVGDDAIFYHTGEERACVGLMTVVSAPQPDPADDRGSWYVAVRPVRPLGRPVPLAELKADPALADFALVRFGRLSVVPASGPQWKRLLSLERTASPGAATVARTRAARGTAPPRRRAAARRRR
jgi:predicted RNA-binding protein with PUA-like domain